MTEEQRAKDRRFNDRRGFAGFLEAATFGKRWLTVLVFLIATAIMAWYASQVEVSAGFKKQLPLNHPYMQTYQEYEEDFPGTNRILVAIMARDGDIFDARFFKALHELTNEVFFIDGVNRAGVRSLFTPNVRYVEVVEGGFAGGNVIPADFDPGSPGYDPGKEEFEKIRTNIVKSGEIGRLVTEDFSGAMVWASLMETNPETGEPIDHNVIAEKLEQIRAEFENEHHTVHIIGFSKIVGDITEGAKSVILFFAITIVLTVLLLYLYSGSLRLTLFPVLCSLMAVVWQLGFLKVLGFGIDPMNILVPFLIFAIGVSHGVQWINAWSDERLYGSHNMDVVRELHVGERLYEHEGVDSDTAAKRAFRQLLTPGIIALLSDTVGFFAIILIEIRIIQELALTASIGVAAVILTNLLFLPVLLSLMRIEDTSKLKQRAKRRSEIFDRLWRLVATVTRPARGAIVIAIAVALLAVGGWQARGVQVGDSQAGVPELRPDARYNQDALRIANEFELGVDQLVVIAETYSSACTEDHEVMETIDRFAWHMTNIEGVQKVISLPQVVKIINAGWNEGSLKWRVLPPNNYVMRQNIQNIDTDTGLLNSDCSAMPVIIFTEDHRAETIDRVVEAVKAFDEKNRERLGDERRQEMKELLTHEGTGKSPELGEWRIRFRLAMGNVGVMAATNEEVRAEQFPMLLYVYGAIIALCLITFRSVRGTLCIVLPLAVVSVLAYALMAIMSIGLKVNTLPVVALGVGVGVDYGIYIFNRLRSNLKMGEPLETAYLNTLRLTGKAVFFTGIALALGVGTWLFSELKFQADMGLLLVFMFLLNMIGAMVLLPALARWLLRPGAAG